MAKKKPDDMASRIGTAMAEIGTAQVPAMAVRIGMLEAGLRELYAAVEGGEPKELADAMDLACGLLMDAGQFE